MWFVLILIWAYIVIFNDHISTIGWWFLFLLWVGLVTHYAIAYRKWDKEMKLRRQERRDRLEAHKKLMQENMEGEHVPSSESKGRL